MAETCAITPTLLRLLGGRMGFLRTGEKTQPQVQLFLTFVFHLCLVYTLKGGNFGIKMASGAEIAPVGFLMDPALTLMKEPSFRSRQRLLQRTTDGETVERK